MLQLRMKFFDNVEKIPQIASGGGKRHGFAVLF
jgi:hypothetical protein